MYLRHELLRGSSVNARTQNPLTTDLDAECHPECFLRQRPDLFEAYDILVVDNLTTFMVDPARKQALNEARRRVKTCVAGYQSDIFRIPPLDPQKVLEHLLHKLAQPLDLFGYVLSKDDPDYMTIHVLREQSRQVAPPRAPYTFEWFGGFRPKLPAKTRWDLINDDL